MWPLSPEPDPFTAAQDPAYVVATKGAPPGWVLLGGAERLKAWPVTVPVVLGPMAPPDAKNTRRIPARPVYVLAAYGPLLHAFVQLVMLDTLLGIDSLVERPARRWDRLRVNGVTLAHATRVYEVGGSAALVALEDSLPGRRA